VLIGEGDASGSATVKFVLSSFAFEDVTGSSQIGFVALGQITTGQQRPENAL
jgi:hypothetical protein